MGPLEEAGLGEGSFGPKINCVRTRLHDKCRQGELGTNFSKGLWTGLVPGQSLETMVPMPMTDAPNCSYTRLKILAGNLWPCPFCPVPAFYCNHTWSPSA